MKPLFPAAMARAEFCPLFLWGHVGVSPAVQSQPRSHLCLLYEYPCPPSRQCSSAAGSETPATRTEWWQTCERRPRGKIYHTCWRNSASRLCQEVCTRSTCVLLVKEGIGKPSCNGQHFEIQTVSENILKWTVTPAGATRAPALQTGMLVATVHSNYVIAVQIKIPYSE